MIHFPILRTRRLTVQLRELTIGEAIALAAMPVEQEEATQAAFLKAAVASVKGLEDPNQWTVQERLLVVCQYLAATADDGPDFAVGAGRYTDYLDGSVDYPDVEHVELGVVGGDPWTLHHLTGAMSQAIERLHGEVPGVSGRFHWVLGGMAAQLTRDGETAVDPLAEGRFDEHLVERMRVLSAYPDSEFGLLMALYLDGRERLHHLFRCEFSADGLVALPTGGTDGALPPARFPVRAGLSGVACDLGRQPVRTGRLPDPLHAYVPDGRPGHDAERESAVL